MTPTQPVPVSSRWGRATGQAVTSLGDVQHQAGQHPEQPRVKLKVVWKGPEDPNSPFLPFPSHTQQQTPEDAALHRPESGLAGARGIAAPVFPVEVGDKPPWFVTEATRRALGSTGCLGTPVCPHWPCVSRPSTLSLMSQTKIITCSCPIFLPSVFFSFTLQKAIWRQWHPGCPVHRDRWPMTQKRWCWLQEIHPSAPRNPG